MSGGAAMFIYKDDFTPGQTQVAHNRGWMKQPEGQ